MWRAPPRTFSPSHRDRPLIGHRSLCGVIFALMCAKLLAIGLSQARFVSRTLSQRFAVRHFSFARLAARHLRWT